MLVIVVIITILIERWIMHEGIEVSVAEMKTRLSDFIAKVAHGRKSFVITRRGRPVAALVNIEDFQSIEQIKEKRGLSAAIGKWSGFEEMETDIAGARISKRNGGRHVSL